MGEHLQTPKELLLELQESTRRYPPERGRPQLPIIDEMLKFEETLGHDRKAMEQDLDRYYRENGDWAEELFLAFIRKNFLPDARAFFEDDNLFAIGTLDKVEVNAQAVRAPNGGWLVLIHGGLFTFLYKIARALATIFVAVGKDGEKPFGGPSLGFEDMCHLIYQVFAWYAGAGIPYGPDFPIHPAQISIANRLATGAETFIICHELAHHLLGHLERSSEKNIVFGNVTVRVSNWAWEDEFEADELGLRLLLGESDKDDEVEDSIMRYTGADFFLQVMSIYEELTEFHYSETHPPASERLMRLRNYAKSLCADEASAEYVLQRAKALEILLTSVKKELLAPTPKYSQLLVQKSKLLSDELDSILEKNTGGFVPNYVGFYEEAAQLLDKGPTDVLANAISERLKMYDRYLGDHVGKPDTDGQQWKTFQKFKLLIGFLERLPAEVKAAIISST